MLKPRNKKKYRRMLVLHFIVVFLIIAVLSAIALSQYAYQRFQLQKEVRVHSEVLHLDLARKVVARNLQQVVIDLHSLAKSPDLQDYLATPDPSNTRRIETDFLNLSKVSRRYDQIRLLDTNGHEKIRIDYNNGAPDVADTAHLQNKSGRYYFQDSINLPEGHIYLSPLDLNVENGKVERPFKPMIRAAIPVFDQVDHQRRGILVLNYFAQKLINHFEEVMANSWGEPMMLNREGYWLVSPQHKDEWSFMLGDKNSFADRYPLAWKTMLKSDTGSVNTANGLFTYITLRPDVIVGMPESDIHATALVWRLLSRVGPATLHFSLWQTARKHVLAVLILLTITAVLSYLLAWLRTNNIEKTEALSSSQARYRNLFENMEEGYALLQALFDSNGKIFDFSYLAVNPAFERIIGLKRAEVVGKTILSLVPDIEDYWIDLYTQVASTCQPGHLEQYNVSFDRYFEINAACPEYGMVAVLFSDVSERKSAEERQRQATTAFNNTFEAIMITDTEQKITVVNQAYTRITGYEARDVIGKSSRELVSDRHGDEFFSHLNAILMESGHWQGEIWHVRKNGEMYPAWENISTVKDEEGRISNFVSVFSDISSIKQTEERLSELAHHDTLTGLANRLAFNLNLDKALERAKRHHHSVTLMFLDLDRFKAINDSMGHAEGDKMLKIVAQRLLNSIRAEDLVARLGGDEFIIILEELDNRDDLAALARKIIEVISAPMKLQDQEVTTSTSIGLSIYPEDASTAAELEKAADTAMYRAKASGRHTFEFYSNE